MTRRRHTPDQIIRKLAEGNNRLAGGAELDEVARHLEIAESTWHRWVPQYGGMKASDAKRAQGARGRNARLKKLLAEAELDKACDEDPCRILNTGHPVVVVGPLHIHDDANVGNFE